MDYCFGCRLNDDFRIMRGTKKVLVDYRVLQTKGAGANRSTGGSNLLPGDVPFEDRYQIDSFQQSLERVLARRQTPVEPKVYSRSQHAFYRPPEHLVEFDLMLKSPCTTKALILD